MTKGSWVYCPSPMFSKTCTFLYICILSYLFSFLELFSSPSPFPIFFFLLPPPPLFPQIYLESKIFLNIQAVPSVVFCSNAVLITTLSSSIQFFSFLDALPSALAPPGMTLMFLMFHILLISLFSSWYFSIFFLLFLANSYVSRYRKINYAQLPSFLFTTAIYGFLSLISLSHWMITSHKITFSFYTTPSGAWSYHFTLLFRLYFSNNF